MWVNTALSRSPLQALFHQYHRQSLAVLAYHDIDSPEGFEQQIQYMTREMHPVSLETVIGAIEDHAELPRHAVLVTFDDGYRSVIDQAMPILGQYQVPALLFVITELLDTDLPFWWDEVAWLVQQGATLPDSERLNAHMTIQQMKRLPDQARRRMRAQLRQAAGCKQFSQPQLRADELSVLESAGITIGNHTHTHPCMNRCDSDTIRQEIRAAHNLLASNLGHSPVAFAYPNGDWDGRAEQTLIELGYQVGFMFDHRLSAMPPQNSLCISRLRVSSRTSMERFKLIVSGVHPAIHHAIGRR
ncbi:MAG: polysaccharide deacetylase family protein [Caldilineaceae bacterium]|nr:polysaccharide deacetylase family protein [Caldilineaceae bacterium]